MSLYFDQSVSNEANSYEAITSIFDSNETSYNEIRNLSHTLTQSSHQSINTQASNDIMESYDSSLDVNNKRLISFLQGETSMVWIIFGTVGNLLSLLVLCRHKMRIHSTFTYLTLLALCDTFVLYFGLLRDYLVNKYKVDINGNILCKFHVFSFYFVLHMASWLLVAVNIDRLIAASFLSLSKKWCTPRTALKVSLWLAISLILLNSHFIYFVDSSSKNSNHHNHHQLNNDKDRFHNAKSNTTTTGETHSSNNPNRPNETSNNNNNNNSDTNNNLKFKQSFYSFIYLSSSTNNYLFSSSHSKTYPNISENNNPIKFSKTYKHNYTKSIFNLFSQIHNHNTINETAANIIIQHDGGNDDDDDDADEEKDDFDYNPINPYVYQKCLIKSNHPNYNYFFQNVFTWIDASAQVILPFIIMVICNANIIHKVLLTKNKTNGKNLKRLRKIKGMCIMIVSVSIIFFILEAPVLIFICLHQGEWISHDWPHNDLLWTIMNLMMYTNHVINFFSYCMTGTKFRRELLRLICFDKLVRFISSYKNINLLTSTANNLNLDTNYPYSKSHHNHLKSIRKDQSTRFRKNFINSNLIENDYKKRIHNILDDNRTNAEYEDFLVEQSSLTKKILNKKRQLCESNLGVECSNKPSNVVNSTHNNNNNNINPPLGILNVNKKDSFIASFNRVVIRKSVDDRNTDIALQTNPFLSSNNINNISNNNNNNTKKNEKKKRINFKTREKTVYINKSSNSNIDDIDIEIDEDDD